MESANSCGFCLQFADSDYSLRNPRTFCGFHLQFLNSTYSCGFRDGSSLLRTYFNICSWIPQNGSKFRTFFLRILSKLLIFGAILSNTVFKVFVRGMQNSREDQSKIAKLRIPRQIWFLPLEESAYKSNNAQFGLVMLNYNGFQTPSVLFWDIHFWLTDRKNCPKALSLPVYTNFDGKRARRKNAIFWWKFFGRKMQIFGQNFFGKKVRKAAKIFWSNQILFLIVICEGSENHLGRPKKIRTPKLLFSTAVPPPPPHSRKSQICPWLYCPYNWFFFAKKKQFYRVHCNW